jgi:hypothetical protein
MNKFLARSLWLLTLACIFFVSSCKKDDPKLPDDVVNFSSDQLGMGSNEDTLAITLTLSRAIETPTAVILTLQTSGVEYGTDFTTNPALVTSTLTVPIASNSTSTSFSIKKVQGALFDGDESVTFTIQSVSNGLVLGEKAAITISFAEIIASSGTMTIEGGGSLFPNKVFIDLSGNRQLSVQRSSWDLLFSDADDFAVLLNSSNQMMARATDKTDINAVTAADTVGWGAQLSFGAVFAAVTGEGAPPEWIADATSWIDDPSGDLAKTAIKAISLTESDNKVYIVNRGTDPGNPGTERGWQKIKITRAGTMYTLQYADINSTSASSIQIARDDQYRFQYVDLSSGAVQVEPKKTDWDFAWTGFDNTTGLGPGLSIPYYFQDVILLNLSGVKADTVMTTLVTYDAFSESDLSKVDLVSGHQLTIGSSWRYGGGPPPAPGPYAYDDRFYVIQDEAGNIYKLRFTALTTDGERGKPQFEFALVKKPN